MRHTIPLALAIALLTLSCARIQPGQDALVVDAERTQALALETFDLFLRLEYQHRDTWSAIPEIHAAAERIRIHGPALIDTVKNLTRAYKHNRGPDQKANLQTALAVLRSLIDTAQTHLAHRPIL
jgi:hypothetical protein